MAQFVGVEIKTDDGQERVEQATFRGVVKAAGGARSSRAQKNKQRTNSRAANNGNRFCGRFATALEAHSLLPQWFPEGKTTGHEFKVGDLGGAPGESLSINLNTGRWADFAGGIEGGDLISLYAAIHNIKQSEAAKQLSNGHDTSAAPARQKATSAGAEKPRIEWTPLMPVPEGTPAPIDDYYRKIGGEWTKLKFIRRWTYLDAQGRAMGHVCRFEMFDADGVMHKDIIPQVWCSGSDGTLSWCWRSMSDPRPLYNLTALLARPDDPVLVVEGEKAQRPLPSDASLCRGRLGRRLNAWRKPIDAATNRKTCCSGPI